jgi:hypothetical protein
MVGNHSWEEQEPDPAKRDATWRPPPGNRKVSRMTCGKVAARLSAPRGVRICGKTGRV